MEDKDIFRTAVFGGYQKDDVADYIRSLENENETIRILANKEKNDLKIQLEKEKTLSEELKKSLTAVRDKLAQLEKEENKPQRMQRMDRAEQNLVEKENSRNEERLQKLQEDQQAILRNQQQQAENLEKIREEIQQRWKQEQERLYSVWERIEKSAELFEKADISEEKEKNVSAVDLTLQQEVQPEPITELRPDFKTEEFTVSGSRSETEEFSGLDADSEAEDSSALDSEPEYPNAPEKADYAMWVGVSMEQTRKRIEELLAELDSF